MQRLSFAKSLIGFAMAVSAGACTAPDVQPPCPVPPGATPDQVLAAKSACYNAIEPKLVSPHRDIDILFVIDNSPSMAPKQKVLAAAIPQFISAIDSTGADYHVGIVTTDLGFNVPDGTHTGRPFPGNLVTACNTAAGDDGILQNRACTSRTELKGEAAAACATLCPDSKYVPSGVPYISKVAGITNVPVSISGGMDIGPQLAFRCLSLVGDQGCGIEQPLEAAKRALTRNYRPENRGFNRESSTLAVIFITDEDDCSVQLAKRAILDPATPNESSPACNTPNQSPDPKCFNVDYRCTALALSCAEPLNTKGAKTNCTLRQDSVLNSIDQYVRFFADLPNPNLVIAGIWTPTLLDNLASNPIKDGQLTVDYINGPMNSAGLNRGRTKSAACYNSDPTLTADPNGFFGQAQLRLSSFVRRFQSGTVSESSICDAANYPKALALIADKLIASPADCFSRAPQTASGTPECLVGFVDASNPHNTPDVALPACSAKCCDFFATDDSPNAANDPKRMPNPHLAAKIAACSAEPADCFCVAPSKVNCLAGAVAGIWRKDNMPPPAGKITSFQCAVVDAPSGI